MSRHTDYNADVHAAITRSLRIGVTRTAAAHIGGISYKTFRNWINRGEAGEEPYAEFVAAVKLAEAEVERTMALAVMDAVVKKKDWKAAQFYLERRVPDFQPKTSMSVDGELKKLLDAVEAVHGKEGAEKVLAAMEGGG